MNGLTYEEIKKSRKNMVDVNLLKIKKTFFNYNAQYN